MYRTANSHNDIRELGQRGKLFESAQYEDLSAYATKFRWRITKRCRQSSALGDEPHARSRRHRRLIESDKRCDARYKKDGWGFSSRCVLRVTRPQSSAFSRNGETTRNGIVKIHHRCHNTQRLGIRLTATARPARGPLVIFHRANCQATAADPFALIEAKERFRSTSCRY